MKFSLNLLFVFIIVVLATVAVPVLKNEVSATTDIAERQAPNKYQNILFNLQILQAVDIMLHFVWDCSQRRFIARTAGAGSTWADPRPPNAPGQLLYALTMHPNGAGITLPGRPGNPSNNLIIWGLDQQTTSVDLEATVDDANNAILQAGEWSYDGITRGLTVTVDETSDTTEVQFMSILVTPPNYGDSRNPPSALGAGFDTASDESVVLRPFPSNI